MAKKKTTLKPQAEAPVPRQGTDVSAPQAATSAPASFSSADISHPPSAVGSPCLTVEVGLYALVAALALAVRLYRLGLAPLSTNEAQLALAALHGTLPASGASPLLTWLNAILFALFGSSDGLARLAPALAGSALVVMPAFLRERIGRVGALFAAAVLAISPVAIMTSRTAGGESIVAAMMLGLIVAGEGYVHDRRTRWLYLGAAWLGIGLASGRTIYSALVTLVIGLGVVAISKSDEVREKWRIIRSTPGLPRRLLIVFAGAFLTCATAFAWRTGGLGATINLLSAWLADFRVQAGTTGWYWPFQVLAVYEPLALIVGIVGLFFALQRSDRFSVMLTIWLVMATALALVRSGRSDGDTLLAVIPLALLSGYAFEALADSLRVVRFRAEEGALMIVLLPVFAYFALGLASYTNNPIISASIGGANLGPAAQLIQSLLALALTVVLVALFAAMTGTEMAVRGTTMVILGALALMTWSAGWGAAQDRPGDPREIIAGPETTSLDVRDLANDLARLSADKMTDTTSLAFVVQAAPDSVLAWYLRKTTNARFVAVIDARSAPSTFITTGEPPTLSSSYAGQRFTLQHEWRIEGKSANDVLKWLLYRRAEMPRPTQEAELWVKQGQ